jgi:hypothetical protein
MAHSNYYYKYYSNRFQPNKKPHIGAKNTGLKSGSGDRI